MGTNVGPVVSEFTVTLEQNRDFEFTVTKPHCPAGLLEEPAPAGRDSGLSLARALAAEIGNDLSASLLLSGMKSRTELGPIRTRVRAEINRDGAGRLRIGKVNVEIDLRRTALKSASALRCFDLFENCLLRHSLSAGSDISVSIVGTDTVERPASPA